MTRICERAAFALVALLTASACGERTGREADAASGPIEGTLGEYALDAPSVQWNLPKRLREISGLAATEDGRVFGHDDERAVIYELDYHAGRIIKAFSLGDGVRDDFEGIAIAGADFYLMTSNGRIYRTREGADGERVAFTAVETDLGRRCELEGLAWDPEEEVLLLPCKLARAPELQGRVAVFAWSPTLSQIVPNAGFEVAERDLASRIGDSHFNPSSIERTSDGHLLLLAGRQHAVAELNRDGSIVAVVELAKTYHRQPEGLTLSPDDDLIVADEGEEGRARIAVYRRKEQ